MNYKKRILATIVGLALIFSVMPVLSAKADVSGDNSAVAIESLEGTA